MIIVSILTFSAECQKEDLIKDISNCVGLITYTDTKGGFHSGTGTFMYKRMSDTTIKIFIVTCKHVLPEKLESRYIEFSIKDFSVQPSKIKTIAIEVYQKNGDTAFNIKSDPNGNDVSVIDMTEFFQSFGFSYLRKTLLPYDLLQIKDSLDLEDIKMGSEVYFIGFPSLLYDKRNIAPLLRIGIVSTDPFSDYYFNDTLRNLYLNEYKETLPERFNGFFIDANATAGSSGSLVFSKPIYQRIEDGQLYYNPQGSAPYILGILDLSFIDADIRSAYQKINIGAVLSSNAIKNTIDLFK